MSTPKDPSIYHITHADNLRGIISAGGLWCDAECASRGVAHTNIGHKHIKQRRLTRRVTAGAGGTLGEYVPFNFCSRSVMLYRVNQGHQDYPGGQQKVVHLVSRVSLAIATKRPWAFSDRHAELAHALHYDDLGMLGEVRWDVMNQHYWFTVKEERQAEFLVKGFFPLTAFTEIATENPHTAAEVSELLQGASHRPRVEIRPEWYY